MESDPTDPSSFQDNAEVLMQMSQGESLSQMLNEGIWIAKSTSGNSDSSTLPQHQQKKRARPVLGSSPASTISIPNSFEDMVRELRMQPLLPPALQPVTPRVSFPDSVFEVDSFGLFFYSSPKTVQCTHHAKVAFSASNTVALRSKLQPGMILSDDDQALVPPLPGAPAALLNLSYENLKALVECLPSTTKTGNAAWVMPFTVTADKVVDLRRDAVLRPAETSFSHALFNYYTNRVINTAGFSEEQESSYHVTIEENIACLISAPSPHFNVMLKFKGAVHAEPVSDAISSLFCRDANYNVQIDTSANAVALFQVSMPKFDPQARMFTLLKALYARLSTLPPATYYLVHAANTPILRVVSESIELFADKPAFNLYKFCSESLRR